VVEPVYNLGCMAYLVTETTNPGVGCDVFLHRSIFANSEPENYLLWRMR
jgi:hypothetical protein